MPALPALERLPTERSPRGAAWTASLALALTLSALQPRLKGLFDGTAELHHFFDRAIGMTTLAGVDASGFAKGYVRTQLLLAITFLACFGALFLLRNWLDRFSPRQAPEHLWLARLSELWVAIVAFGVFLPRFNLRSLEVLLAHLVLMALAILVVRHRPELRDRRWLGPWTDIDRHVLLATMLWPWPTLIAVWTFAGRPPGFQDIPATVGFLIWGSVWLAGLFLIRRTDPSSHLRWMTAAVPWLLVPVALPVANEIQAKLRFADPRHIAVGLILGLIAVSVVVWWLQPACTRRSPLRASRLLYSVYFPLIAMSAAGFKFHQHKRDLGHPDYFHLGEQALPTHQLFNASKLPFVDLRLSHSLSDMAFAWLYAVIHGIQGLDMLVWAATLERIVGVVLCYFLLARIFTPSYAVLAVLLLPILSSIRSYYVLVLLPALFLARALQRPTTGRFVALWCSLAALALWRIDFGMAAGVATAGVLGVHLVRGRHRRRALARSLAWMAGGAGVVVLGLWGILGSSALGTLAFYFNTYSYRLITRTRPEVFHEFTSAAVLQYYVLPSIALVYVVYLATQRLVLRRYVSNRKLMLTFLATFSLVMSVRSMERHSLIEIFNPYLGLLLLAVLPVLWSRTAQAAERRATRIALAATLVFASLFALPPSQKAFSDPSSIALLQQQPMFRFHRFAEGEPRVTFVDQRHRDLLKFIDRFLGPDETFFDFTNSPLLYVLADREFPTYVIPNLIQTSETVQQRVLEELTAYLDGDRMPLVIFKQGNSFWDATDGVANEVRSYRVAEWIYQHYRPVVQVGRYQLWWQADRPAPTITDLPDSVYPLPRLGDTELATKHLYSVTAKPLDHSAVELQGSGPDPHAFGLFDLSATPELDSHETWRLDLAVSWPGDEPLQMFFGYDGAYFRAESTAWVLPGDVSEGRAQIPLPRPANARRLTDIRFDPPADTVLHLADLHLKGSSSLHRSLTANDLRQSFDLGHLPAIWARFDPLEARTATADLAVLLDAPIRLEAGEQTVLQIPRRLPDTPSPPAVGVPHGTYLDLQIRPLPAATDEEPDVSLAYGDAPHSSFHFDLTTVGSSSQVLRRHAVPILEDLEPYALGERWALRAVGPAPRLLRPFDLPLLPASGDAQEWLLEISYRSRNPGTLEVCAPCDSLNGAGRSREAIAFGVTSDHGRPATLMLPVPAAGYDGDALAELGLRFSFEPTEAGGDPLFEIVEARRVHWPEGWRNYLVRLTTQWRWWQGDAQSIELRASRPMIVERVCLRGGD